MFSARWIVIITYVVMIVANVISSTSNLFNHTNNTHISNENPTTLTPDGITFSVWGPIYLFEFALVIYQSWSNTTFFNQQQRLWIALSFILNAAWLPVFAYEYWWLSLFIICGYWSTLTKAYQTLNIDYANQNNIKDKCCAYTGISLNLAWVTVATLLNITIVFRNSKIVFTESNNTIIGGNPDWAVACIVAAFAIATYRIVFTADIIYAGATAWALFGIYRKQTDIQTTWAFIGAICLLSFSFIRFIICFKKNKSNNISNQLTQHLNV